MAERTERRPALLATGWFQAAILVIVFGFTILLYLAIRAYVDAPPIPARVVDASGRLIFTGDDVIAGQELFLRNGIMEYGSIFGHGAYLGPDYTADYLRRAALAVREQYGGEQSDAARARTVEDFKTNRYDPPSDTLTFTAAQAAGFDQARDYYQGFFAEPSTRFGLRPRAIADPQEVTQLTAFFAWSAWASAANRPGLDYSYTNNWPPEPLVDNAPTADNIVWSVLSLIALLGGIGALLAIFGRWNILGWHGREQQRLSFMPPGAVALTPAQRATAFFFLLMALLFLLQTAVGGATQHYRADLAGFFGIDLALLLPYNLARTWHLQLAIFWVATSFLAAGIFLAPMIAGREPRGQHILAYVLLAALAIVVAGSLIGTFLGIHGWRGGPSGWFGNQGLEYLDLGRFWQALLSVGLIFWAVVLFRGIRVRLSQEHFSNMPWLFFYAALAVPAFYAVGLLSRPTANFTTTDFWRFWVVHLWVEDFLELFATAMVAYIFVLLGVVAERIALRVIYLDIILYSIGGVVGTMHHLYFSGTPAVTMALGAFFSAAEVIPLTFLTVEAWSFLQLGAIQEAKSVTPFPHRWAVMSLASVGFWNFVGAGIFGFLVNLPIVSYYEIGTALTANHAHASMMGVYGMLAVGFSLFCLRYLIPAERWSDRAAQISFWSLNAGLAWMCFATLLPLGIVQLYASVGQSYWEARSLDFLTNRTNVLLEWMRLPGDIVVIVGGVLPLLYLCWLGVRYRVSKVTLEEPVHPLFTEITTPAAAP
ncbi:MAG: cbb3-type cytochrome c oxidase subunit I [Chloroflexi bacterium]|nr:cbb3-type cytochrome c oxidase subunit I [Chloroflexota bacterium]